MAFPKQNCKKKVPGKIARPEKETPPLKATSRKLSHFIKPMLPKETDEVFNDPGWIFEIKWDGYRAIAEIAKEIRLYSRNGNSFTNTYPLIMDALSKFRHHAILDGEICV